MKGWLALDIDGTLTDEMYSIPQPVVDCLKSFHEKGWNIFLSTGRSFTFAIKGLDQLSFPYYFSIQNGSAVLKMPERETLFTSYLHKEVLGDIQQAMSGIDGIIAVYSGHMQEDKCYWLRDGLKPVYKTYLEELMRRQHQEGREVDSFAFPDFDEISLVKCVGPLDQMKIVAEKLKKHNSCSFSMIKDPFDERFYILMITKKGVDKGHALQELILKNGNREMVIAAGNDGNDLSLFREADWSIAMKNSPASLLEKADFVAPSVQEMGIISALKHAVSRN